MTTFHIVGIQCTVWTKDTILSAPIIREHSGGNAPDPYAECLWVVGGQWIDTTNVYGLAKGDLIDKSVDRILLRLADEHTLAGQPLERYLVTQEVMRFQFRPIGTGYESGSWGFLDSLSGDIGLDETFGHDITEFVRIARRKLQAEPEYHELTFVTVYEHGGYSNHYEGFDQEWFLVGTLDLSVNIWKALEQKPGDQCSECQGSGWKEVTGWGTFRNGRRLRWRCGNCIDGRLPDQKETTQNA